MPALADTRFVYLSHTSPRAHAENYFSILCLMHKSGLSQDLNVVVYTDDPVFYRDLPIQVKEISAAMKERASNGYRNKLKSLVMCDAADGDKAAMIYCDGDTWMRRHPARLVEMVTARRSVMHIPEVRLVKTSDPNKRKLRHLLEMSDIWVDRDSGRRINPRSWMWNSGVVGIHVENFGLLQKAIDIGDQIHALDPTLFSVEQFSLGQALRTGAGVGFADSEVFHFWVRDIRDPFSLTIDQEVERLRGLELEQRAASAYTIRPRYTGRAWLKMRLKKSAWTVGINTPSVRTSV